MKARLAGKMMQNTQAITKQLESYLHQLSAVSSRWTEWLAVNERAVLANEIDQLPIHAPAATEIMDELKAIVGRRSELLATAASIGLVAPTLDSLARQLPAWKESGLRTAMQRAKTQISQMRRLQTAAWVLMHESFCFYQGTMSLLTAGKSHQAVYTKATNSDMGSGQLLDANL